MTCHKYGALSNSVFLSGRFQREPTGNKPFFGVPLNKTRPFVWPSHAFDPAPPATALFPTLSSTSSQGCCLAASWLSKPYSRKPTGCPKPLYLTPFDPVVCDPPINLLVCGQSLSSREFILLSSKMLQAQQRQVRGGWLFQDTSSRRRRKCCLWTRIKSSLPLSPSNAFLILPVSLDQKSHAKTTNNIVKSHCQIPNSHPQNDTKHSMLLPTST